MWKRFVVKKNEYALLFREGEFERLLPPGRHSCFDPFGRLALRRWNASEVLEDRALVDYLFQFQPEVTEHLDFIELQEHEAGLRYENEVLVEVMAPGTRSVFWKGPVRRQVAKINLQENYMLAPAVVAAAISQPAARGKALKGLTGVLPVVVPAYSVGILRVDGKVVQLLEPGVFAFLKFGREIAVQTVDLRMQALEVAGQEILSRDKVSLRLNLQASWRFSDVLLAYEKLPNPAEYLYRELQFGLRAAVGTRSLDELLENKQVIDEVVTAHVTAKLAGLGLVLESVGVKDIVLPGEMKTILAQVVQAGKAAEANVIRRREETSATRSLLNTARVMEGNPVALRLKELETLERVAERIDRISVFGGLDQVLSGLVNINQT